MHTHSMCNSVESTHPLCEMGWLCFVWVGDVSDLTDANVQGPLYLPLSLFVSLRVLLVPFSPQGLYYLWDFEPQSAAKYSCSARPIPTVWQI